MRICNYTCTTDNQLVKLSFLRQNCCICNITFCATSYVVIEVSMGNTRKYTTCILVVVYFWEVRGVGGGGRAPWVMVGVNNYFCWVSHLSPIIVHDGVEAMSNSDDSALTELTPNRLLNEVVSFQVHSCCGFIQH